MSKYISRLTDEDIETFFNDNGFQLVKDLTDDNVCPIDAIERGDENIYVRVQQINRNQIDIELEKFLIQKSPSLMSLSSLASMRSCYGRNLDLIYFSDYFLSKFCINSVDNKLSEELCSAYIKFMIEKFPTYKKDFIEYCDSFPDDELENELTI